MRNGAGRNRENVMLKNFAASDGTFIGYRVDGPEEAPVLVLSNSIGTTMDLWSPQLQAFSREFRVVRYDSRGHGRSSAPRGDYTIARLGLDVLDLMDWLAVAQFSYCGLSLGGMVGQWLGVQASERLDSLALCNTSAFMGPAGWETRIQTVRKGGMGSIGNAVLDRWFTPGFRQEKPETVAKMLEMLMGIDPTGYTACCAAIRDMDQRGDIAAIAAPCLIVAGSEDKATPLDHSEFLASTIPGAQLETLKAAHLSNIERSDDFTAALLNFLNQHKGPAHRRARLS